MNSDLIISDITNFQFVNVDFVGIDFGVGNALALYGPEGPMNTPKLPPIPGGAATSDKFVRILPILLDDYNVVCESATIGSSGVEPNSIAQIVHDAPNDLYVISGRAVKNFRNDAQREWRKGARYAKGRASNRILLEQQEDVHIEDAEIIYIIATEFPKRLRKWSLPVEYLHRQHTSVRPHDKRNYRGPIPDGYMSRLPAFEQLPQHLQNIFGKGTGHREYSRAKVLPFAMALDEHGSQTREGYEKIIGLYEHGYPSFYRRATIVIMQNIAKELAGTTRNDEVPPYQRKEAWRITRKYIREFYHRLIV